MGFGLFSLALVAAGSLLAGAGLVTSIIRGIEGAIIFGLLAWFFYLGFGSRSFIKTKATQKPNDNNGMLDAGNKND